MTVIEVRDLVKRFRIPSVRRDTVREHALDLFRPRPHETLTVLDGTSFAVQRGETIGIMGRNGCGKSTLLRIMSGIYQADGGVVTVRAAITPILELGVGWNPELDAIDNVCLMGVVMGMSLPEVRAATDDILAFAELERFANMKLQHFSSGMASRLAYSVAFKAVRDVLVLDEIFSVGDAGFKARCEQRYRELSAAGHTVILVSHDPRIISTFCPRALLLDRGRVLVDGTGADVAAQYLELLAIR
jgi:ABC-type polysaccharide/polyol phosphate transport system ATPase subunit